MNSTATGMSVSCSGVVRSAEEVDLGAERDDRERDERRDRRDDRREEEDDLVGRLGDDVLLERELHAVGQRLQQAEGAVHVGADAVLHAGHDAALEPDVEQRQQDQDQEDEDGLEQDQPPRVLAEGGQVRRRAGPLPAERCSSCVAPFTVTVLPGEARSARTPRPKDRGRDPDDVVGQVGDLDGQRHRCRGHR